MLADYRIGLPAISHEAADGRAREVLDRAQGQVGFIPNMYARMVNSPGLLETYLDGYAVFRAESGFSPSEQELVLLVISRTNGCEYCMAAHSMLARSKSGMDAAVLEAVRNRTALPDPRLAALAAFTEHLVTTRGLPEQAAVESFLAAGYEERQILEIVLAIAVKTLSNYANHLFHTPVDEVFAADTWRDD